MIYVFESGSVVYDESLTKEEKKSCVAIESLPIAESIKGKKPQIKADLKTQTVFYEYFDYEEAETPIVITLDGLNIDEVIDLLKWRGVL